MGTVKNGPALNKAAGWVISALAFIIGFFHSALGLKEFKVLGSENGSFAVAGIILLVMVFGYSAAIKGRKEGLVFYLIGASMFFVFNLNSFYPTYLGRTLVKEEAKVISDSLTAYRSAIYKIVENANGGYMQAIQELKDQQNNMLREIKERKGTGPFFREALRKFNDLTGSNISSDRNIRRDSAGLQEQYDYYKDLTNNAIKTYIAITLNGEDQNGLKLVEAKESMDVLNIEYKPKLEAILKNNAKVDIADIENNTEVKTMEEVVARLDEFAITVNGALHKPRFTLFNRPDGFVFPRTQKLGSFQHTMMSVKERLTHTDTLGVILICLLIDFLAPLAVYVIIRKREDDDWGQQTQAPAWRKIMNGNRKPQTF